MLKNHHVLESKVAEAQVAQVAQAALVARERPGGLRVVHQTAHAPKAQAEKAHGAKGAGLREAHRTAHAAKDQAGTQAA